MVNIHCNYLSFTNKFEVDVIFRTGAAYRNLINYVTSFVDTIAMIVVYILKMPEIEVIYVADALDWFFYVILPNYCFSGGILSLFENQVYTDLCEMQEMKKLCKAIRNTNNTNLCCQGKWHLQ